MSTKFDIIVIGGGPSGMIAAKTASHGNLLNPESKNSLKVLLLEKHNLGGIAQDFSLRCTPNWILGKSNFMDKLKQDLVSPNIKIKCQEEVVSINSSNQIKTVTTDKNTYECKAIIIACGIYPFSHLIKNKRVTHLLFSRESQKYIFQNLLKYNSPESKVLVVQSTYSKACFKAIQEALPKAKLYPLVSHGENKKALKGKLINVMDSGEKCMVQIMNNSKKQKASVDYVIIDYNSFKIFPESIDFLPEKMLTKKHKLEINQKNETILKGVFACGNITTELSGVLSATASGFSAGIYAHEYVYKKKFKKNPELFPWLADQN